jgi:glyoxylase-like metal-dependent hydrolase (beta-lactamase superfamily II)
VPAVTRVALAYNSVYLVDNPEGCVAVDAGPDYYGSWEVLAAASGGRRPSLVVATHGHIDHAGLGWRWQRAGVPVALSQLDAHFADGPLFSKADAAGMLGYLRAAGAPAEVVAEARHGLEQRRQWAARISDPGYPEAPRDGRWPTGLRYERFVPDRLLDGEGPWHAAGLEVVACPGHTPGNLVLVVPAEGWLFSGDQLLPDITPTPAIQFRDGKRLATLPEFERSLAKLGELHLTRCFPGHGDPFEDVAGAIAANLGQLEQRAERVHTCLRDEGPATAYQVALRLYPRALRRRLWQILATVQGHLDVLEAQRRTVLTGSTYEPL